MKLLAKYELGRFQSGWKRSGQNGLKASLINSAINKNQPAYVLSSASKA
jgi:hypothetical protein